MKRLMFLVVLLATLYGCKDSGTSLTPKNKLDDLSEKNPNVISCKSDEYLVEGKCVKNIPTCNLNEILIDNKCVACAENEVIVENACVKCAEGETKYGDQCISTEKTIVECPVDKYLTVDAFDPKTTIETVSEDIPEFEPPISGTTFIDHLGGDINSISRLHTKNGTVYEFYNIGNSLNAVRLSQNEILDRKTFKEIIYSVSSVELDDGTIIVTAATRQAIMAYQFKDNKFIDFKTFKLSAWAGKQNLVINSMKFTRSIDYSVHEIGNLDAVKAQLSINKLQSGDLTAGLEKEVTPDYVPSKSIYLYFSYGSDVYRVKPEMLGGGCVERVTHEEGKTIKKVVAEEDRVLLLIETAAQIPAKWKDVDLTDEEKKKYTEESASITDPNILFLFNRYLFGEGLDRRVSLLTMSQNTKDDVAAGIISDISLSGDKITVASITKPEACLEAFSGCVGAADHFSKKIFLKPLTKEDSIKATSTISFYKIGTDIKNTKNIELKENKYKQRPVWNIIFTDNQNTVIAGAYGYLFEIKDGILQDNSFIIVTDLCGNLYTPSVLLYDKNSRVVTLEDHNLGIIEIKLAGYSTAAINRPLNTPVGNIITSAGSSFFTSNAHKPNTGLTECPIKKTINKLTMPMAVSKLKEYEYSNNILLAEYENSAVAFIQGKNYFDDGTWNAQLVDLSNVTNKYTNILIGDGIDHGMIHDIYLFEKSLFTLTEDNGLQILGFAFDTTKITPNTFSYDFASSSYAGGVSTTTSKILTAFKSEENIVLLLLAHDGKIAFMSTKNNFPDVVTNSPVDIIDALVKGDTLYTLHPKKNEGGDIVSLMVSKYKWTYDNVFTSLTLTEQLTGSFDYIPTQKGLFKIDKNNMLWIGSKATPESLDITVIRVKNDLSSAEKVLTLNKQQIRNFDVDNNYIYLRTPDNGLEIYSY